MPHFSVSLAFNAFAPNCVRSRSAGKLTVLPPCACRSRAGGDVELFLVGEGDARHRRRRASLDVGLGRTRQADGFFSVCSRVQGMEHDRPSRLRLCFIYLVTSLNFSD
jgi:hypothetical protein